jgi:hypothetical protein
MRLPAGRRAGPRRSWRAILRTAGRSSPLASVNAGTVGGNRGRCEAGQGRNEEKVATPPGRRGAPARSGRDPGGDHLDPLDRHDGGDWGPAGLSASASRRKVASTWTPGYGLKIDPGYLPRRTMTVTVRKGGVLLLHGHTPHGSDANRSEIARWNGPALERRASAHRPAPTQAVGAKPSAASDHHEEWLRAGKRRRRTNGPARCGCETERC